MSLLGKKGRGGQQDEVHTRSQYVDHSQKFLAWVNQLGFEKSLFGRVAYYLDHRFRIRRLLLLFLFSLGLSFVLFFELQIVGDYSVGEIVPADIKSPISLNIVDEVATEAKRAEAERGLPLILDYEPDAYENLYNRIYRAFRNMRNIARDTRWPKDEIAREEAVKDFLKHKPAFEQDLGANVPDLLFEWLAENKFSVRIENLVIRAISRWSNFVITDISDYQNREFDHPVIVRELIGDRMGPEETLKMADVKNLRDPSQFALEGVRGYNQLRPREQERLKKLTLSLLPANATLNKAEYAERQKRARSSVLPVQISIKKNQTIVSAGSPVQPVHLTILQEIQNIRSQQRKEFLSLYSALLFVVVVVSLFAFLRRYSRESLVVRSKDILVMGLITIGNVTLVRLFVFVMEATFVDRIGETIPHMAYLFGAPVAAGALLVGLLMASVEIVWIFTLFTAVTMAVMADLNFSYFIVVMVSGVAAAHGVFNCTKRNDIHWAGLRAGAVAALTILLVYSLDQIGQENFFRNLVWCVGAGFFGGILSSFIAMVFLPILESAFNYTTDIKLLELANLNHPIMQQMMMKAPGTYHHAMNVGNMVDAAAKEIGANPLLAKVMAYYHDIGKMEHAQYFIENQRPGYNPHDHISPHMSKTILIAHVKDGAEMAIKHKLGKPIVDGILQHHGTTLISYFYNRALEEQNADTTGTVEESDFRYPGPKPQFKEAALVMLADSIEATARSLEEPTAGRLGSIVENIIESKFMDGQLNECNLTIHELAVIKRTFRHMLMAMYHHRLDYPHMRDGKVVEVPAKNGKSQQKRA